MTDLIFGPGHYMRNPSDDIDQLARIIRDGLAKRRERDCKREMGEIDLGEVDQSDD